MSWWNRMGNRGRFEDDLDAELRDHVERQMADHVRAGLSPRDARRRARLEFGGLDQVKETCRDARGTRWLEETWQDLRFAVRLLARERWFAAAAVLSLGLGIGLTSTAFTVYNAVLVRGLPVDDPDRIMALATRDAAGREQGVSYLDFQDWRAAATSFEDIAAYSEPAMNVGDPDMATERFFGARVTANAFRLLGVEPLLGRDFSPADDRPGTPTCRHARARHLDEPLRRGPGGARPDHPRQRRTGNRRRRDARRLRVSAMGGAVAAAIDYARPGEPRARPAGLPRHRPSRRQDDRLPGAGGSRRRGRRPRGKLPRDEQGIAALGRTVQRALQRHAPTGPDGAAGRRRRRAAHRLRQRRQSAPGARRTPVPGDRHAGVAGRNTSPNRAATARRVPPARRPGGGAGPGTRRPVRAPAGDRFRAVDGPVLDRLQRRRPCAGVRDTDLPVDYHALRTGAGLAHVEDERAGPRHRGWKSRNRRAPGAAVDGMAGDRGAGADAGAAGGRRPDGAQSADGRTRQPRHRHGGRDGPPAHPSGRPLCGGRAARGVLPRARRSGGGGSHDRIGDARRRHSVRPHRRIPRARCRRPAHSRRRPAAYRGRHHHCGRLLRGAGPPSGAGPRVHRSRRDGGQRQRHHQPAPCRPVLRERGSARPPDSPSRARRAGRERAPADDHRRLADGATDHVGPARSGRLPSVPLGTHSVPAPAGTRRGRHGCRGRSERDRARARPGSLDCSRVDPGRRARPDRLRPAPDRVAPGGLCLGRPGSVGRRPCTA